MKFLIINNKKSYNLDCVRQIEIVAWGENDNRIVLYSANNDDEEHVLKGLTKEQAQAIFDKIFSLMPYEDVIYIGKAEQKEKTDDE